MSKELLLAGALLASLDPAAAGIMGSVTGAIVSGIADQQQPEFRSYFACVC